MKYPRLYKLDSKGLVRFWQIEIDGEGSYRSTAGLLEGNPTTSEWTLCKPKNVGRSNETTPAQQCLMEVEALYTKKRDKHYVDNEADVRAPRRYFEVMLAETYDEKTRKQLFKVPNTMVWIQPKLDGLRGATTDEGTFSRGGNEFITVKFISEYLKPLFDKFPGLVVDGELYNHDFRDDFNEIVSAIKREKPSDEDYARARDLAQLHVYDCFLPSEPHMLFEDRIRFILTELKALGLLGEGSPIHFVKTTPVYSFEQLEDEHQDNLRNEYEGSIIRLNDIYRHKRVKTLLKWKEFFEREFPVLRLEQGTGNWDNAIKRVVCRNDDGSEFGCGIRGTRPRLKAMYENNEQFATATVRYPNLTPDGVPRFGVVTRLYEGERDD